MLRGNRKRPPDTEAAGAALIAGGAGAAVRRAEVPRIVAPGAAAQNAGSARSGSCRSVSRCAIVIRGPAILHPLIHVAVHVMETEGVRCITADWRSAVRVRPCRRPAVARRIPVARLVRRDRIAPRERHPRTRPRRVLPLAFRQQAIALPADAPIDPRHVGFCIVPRHVDRRKIATAPALIRWTIPAATAARYDPVNRLVTAWSNHRARN